MLIAAVAVGCTFTSADPETPSDPSDPSDVSPSAAEDERNSSDSDAAMSAYIADGSTVEDFAQNYIDYVSEHFQENVPEDYQINIVESKLTGLECVARFGHMTDYPIELWKLEYRLKPDNMSLVMFAGGMSQEGGWITQLGSTGSPVLIVGVPGQRARLYGHYQHVEHHGGRQRRKRPAHLSGERRAFFRRKRIRAATLP